MIRVYKSPNIPASLISTAAYNGEDVKKQLLADQHDKCYICERYRDTDFEIEQRIDFVGKKVLFSSHVNDIEHTKTIELLNKIFNGSKHVRTIKEERFFEQAISIINRFSDLVYSYLSNPSIEMENAINDELTIDKELLGFKYWMIHDNPSLYAVFKRKMVWNR